MRNRSKKIIAIGIIFTMAIFASASVGVAAEVTLAWDPHENTHSNLSGYYIYYKAGSSVQANPDGATLIYIALTDPGFDLENPSYTVTDLMDDTQYFFAVTAMVEDDESGMSNEVSTTNGSSALETHTDAPSAASGGGGGGGCFINSLIDE